MVVFPSHCSKTPDRSISRNSYTSYSSSLCKTSNSECDVVGGNLGGKKYYVLKTRVSFRTASLWVHFRTIEGKTYQRIS